MKDEFIIFSDTNMPTHGWIQGCFTCYTPTAQMIIANKSIYKLICTRISNHYTAENCKLFMCYTCQNDIKNEIITEESLYNFCDKHLKNYY
jgi:hypothetical protein